MQLATIPFTWKFAKIAMSEPPSDSDLGCTAV